MADDPPSSPLSSPPLSVINVAINSPTGNEHKMPLSSPLPDPTAETIEGTANLSLAGPGKNGEAEEEVQTSDETGQPSSQKRKASISRKLIPAKKPRGIVFSASKKLAKDRKWEAPFVYTDTKSPLAKADLRAILLHPDAWDVLTQEEKQDVLAKFPDDTHILAAGTPGARPNPVSLRNYDNFRHDCARYCENIELGHHDDEWLTQAWTAHEKHKRGGYDEFLREQFEETWEIQLPRESEAEDVESDCASGTEPTGSKQDVMEPAASSHPQASETPTENLNSRRSSQSATGDPSSQHPHSSGEINEQGDNAAMTRDKTVQPTNPTGIGSNNPSTASQQEEVTSIVGTQSD